MPIDRSTIRSIKNMIRHGADEDDLVEIEAMIRKTRHILSKQKPASKTYNVSPKGSIGKHKIPDDYLGDWNVHPEPTDEAPDVVQDYEGGTKGYRPDRKVYQDDDFERAKANQDAVWDSIKSIL